MGLFDFLFRRGDREIIARVNYTLKNSFHNVKKDVTHIHKTISDHKEYTNKRFQEVEEKFKKLELILNSNHPQKLIRIIQNNELKEEIEEPIENDNLLNMLRGIPKAELNLFKTLYGLQQSLNAKHISYKSLASYLYPGREYNSIRSTITQFVLRLHTEGLIEKQRIGKETYVKISQNGYKLLKSAKIKKAMKEIEVQN